MLRPPLEGVRVLDLTRVIAGPYCTMLLADLGADVVKVEEPGKGDELRWIVRYEGRSAHDEDYFYGINRGKRSITLDLKRPEDRETALALAQRADVLVQNFAPGVAERLGLGYETVRDLNPGLIYCAISGYGQTGPYRDRRSVDPIIQSMSGMMSVTGEADGRPMRVGVVVSDVLAGIFAAYTIAGALHGRTRDGAGRFIDLSMLDATIALLGPRMVETLQAGKIPLRVGNENPMRAPANIFLAADGQYVDLMVQNDSHWEPFCRALQREEWLRDERFTRAAGRIQHRAELNELVAARLRERPAAEWVEVLNAARIPCGVVNDYARALDDEQVRHRGLVLDVEHPQSGHLRLVGPPWQMTGAPPTLQPPPLLGADRDEVLREWLGASDEDGGRSMADGARRAFEGGDMAGKLTRLRLNQGIAGVFYIMHNIAQEIGAFEQEGLEIQTSTSELGAQVGLLDRGEVDLTIGGPMRTLRLQANEGKLLVNFCSAVRASPWMLLGRTPEPELTPSRLVGKNVIDFKEAPTPILCLRYWLRQGGVQPEQVHFRNDLSMPDAVTAFLAGEGDYLLHSLHSAQPLLDSGQAHVALDLATALGGIPWSTYYATPATIAAKREELDAFTRAIYRAERWLHGHGAAEVARLVGKYYPHFDEGTLTRAIAYYQGNELWPRDPLVPREDIDRFQDVLFDSGWISRRVPYEDQVDTGFAERAVKALGSA